MTSGEMMAGEEKPGKLSFLDLAAELRNNIYEDVLVHNRLGKRIATAAILRVSRQVYHEAKPLLYAQSSLQLKLSPEMKGGQPACRIGGDLDGHIDTARPLHTLAVSWPSCVNTIGILSVMISFKGVSAYREISSACFGIINKVLYSLVCHIRTAPKGKTIKRTISINIHNTPLHHAFFRTDYSTLEQVFYPLAKVPKDVDLQLGYFFHRIEKHLNDLRDDDIDAPTLQFNAIEANAKVFAPFEYELRRAIAKNLSGTETPATRRVNFHTDALEKAKQVMGRSYIYLDDERTLEACHEVMSRAVTAMEDETQGYVQCGGKDQTEGIDGQTGSMVIQGPMADEEERREVTRAILHKREVERREGYRRQMPLEEWEEILEEAEDNPWMMMSN